MQMQSVLKPDAALLISGRVRHEENQKPRVVVSAARPLESAVDNAKAQLRIRFNLDALREGRLEELAGILAGYPGESPVVFELARPGDFVVRIQSRVPRGVKADDELLQRLRDLCGEEAIRLEKQAQGM